VATKLARQSNISIDQGTDYTLSLTVEDDDGETLSLAGYTANAQIRKHYMSANSIDFIAEIQDNTAILLTLTPTQTVNVEPGRYVYDVEIRSPANTVTRVVEGICTIRAEVTR
jgi:hypothetical protein